MPMIDLVPDTGALPPTPSFGERDASQDFPTPIPMAIPLPLPLPAEPRPFIGNELELPLAQPDVLDIASLDPAASFTLDLPGPESLAPPPPPPKPRPSRRPRLSGVMMETRPPSSFDPRAEPDTPPEPRRTPLPVARPVERDGPASARRSIEQGPLAEDPDVPSDRLAHERPTPLRPPQADLRIASKAPIVDAADVHVLGETATTSWMHGASLPPYRLESPPPLLPKAPLFPKLGGATDELAEHLALPPGFGAEAPSLLVLPTSVLEARVQFTMLGRELGLDYRLKRGLDLRADVSGLEAMQAVLLESFPEHLVRSPDEGYELRRHGALLSEILARRLDAEWLDISPKELGYWVMIVPPDTRVWPFGRVARLVAMGHKERDLVSYFFELQARARR